MLIILLHFSAVTKELTTALEMAVKSSGNGKKSKPHFDWSSIVLRCGKIYPELVSNFDKSERASTAVGNYHSHQQELLPRPNLPAMANEVLQFGPNHLLL